MRIALIAVLLACCAGSWGGVLQLRSGERVEGDIRRSTKGWEVTTADGKVRIIPEADVTSIQSSGPSSGGVTDASARLSSLRRSVEALTDIDQVLQRYEQAMPQLKGTPQEADAQQDVSKWKKYQQQGMVKIGREWLTPDQVSALDERNLTMVEQAKGLVKQARLKDANAVLDQVLESDPGNVAALYLKGFVAYRQDQIPVARRAFEQVVNELPGHGAALNNLAVTQWRQNATGIAMTNFQRAMTAMPLNSAIHDNVAEMLNALPQDVRETPQLRKLQSQFQQDEPKLQASMQEAGWFRWGGTWVRQEQLEELRAQEQRIKSELDRLSADFDQTQREIERIDDRISMNNTDMSRIEGTSWGRDADGNVVRLQLPNSYRELERENDNLKLRRKRELDRLDVLREQARHLRAQITVPPFTGQMRLIDEQSTPVKLRKVEQTKRAAE